MFPLLFGSEWFRVNYDFEMDLYRGIERLGCPGCE